MANIGNSFQNSCILVSVGVVAILINSAVVTRFGRRRVFLVCGLLLCGLTQLLTAVIYTVSPGTEATGRGIVGLAVIYILGYNVSKFLRMTTPNYYANASAGNGGDVRLGKWR
jgi:MFS transporter, SP family, sugar:H+ symporter